MSHTQTQANYPSLKEKVAFITGGGTGIGAELVRFLCAQDVNVVFADIDNKPSEKLQQEMATAGKTARYINCDVTDTAQLKVAIDSAFNEFSRLDILVNNAADDERHDISNVDEDYWETSLNLNLKPYFFAAKAALPYLQKNGGSIINMGSASWRLKQPCMPLYTTAKAAIEGLTRSLASNLGKDKIRVNTLIPGWVKTEKQMSKWLNEEIVEETIKAQCIPQTLEPSDIAKAVLFLASDESKMMTAQTLIIDAGWI